MSQRWSRRTCLLAMLGLASVAQRSAQGQDLRLLPYDMIHKRFDEWRLQHDQARLQDDINLGNADGVGRDLNRIRKDEWRIWHDRWRIRWDLGLPPGPYVPRPRPTAPGAALAPLPQYPG